jgi:hypothetical protein
MVLEGTLTKIVREATLQQWITKQTHAGFDSVPLPRPICDPDYYLPMNALFKIAWRNLEQRARLVLTVAST